MASFAESSLPGVVAVVQVGVEDREVGSAGESSDTGEGEDEQGVAHGFSHGVGGLSLSAAACAAANSRSRSSRRRSLPLAVFGSSATNSIRRGYLYGAVTRFTCSCSSRASASDAAWPGAQHDERLHHFAALGVGARDGGRLLDGRVLDQRVLDLHGADAVARRADHVVGAPFVEEIARLVPAHDVAGQPVLDALDGRLRGRGLLRLLPVAEHDLRVRQPDRELARRARRRERPVRREERDLGARQRLPHRAGLHRHARIVQHRHERLGLPVAVEERHAGLVDPAAHDLRVDGLPGGHREPQRREIGAREILGDQAAQLGRGGAEHGDPVARKELEARARIEPAIVEEHLRAAAPRPEEDARARLAPAGVRGAPHQVVGAQVEPVPRRHAPRPDRARRVRHALRVPGRAGGVVHDRRVVGGERDGLERLGLRGEGRTELEPAVGRADRGAQPERRRVRELAGVRGGGHRRHCTGVRDAIADVLRGQHVDARDRDRAGAQDADHRDLPLGQPRQHHDHPVALAHAVRGEEVREPARSARDVAEREAPLAAAVVGPDERGLAFGRRPVVDDVAREIEPLGHRPAEAPRGRGVVGHPGREHRVVRPTWFD